MNIEEIKIVQSDPSLPFPINQRNYRWSKLIINHWIALKLEFVSNHFDKSGDISIYSPSGQEIGFICFTSNLRAAEIEYPCEQLRIEFIR